MDKKCIILMGKCVINCSTYNIQIKCVDSHCGWNGSMCVRECSKYKNRQSCNVDMNGCFWIMCHADKNISGSCLIVVLYIYILYFLFFCLNNEIFIFAFMIFFFFQE
jgi:hypothetical protein